MCIRDRQALEPENEYLGVTEKPAWEALARLVAIKPGDAHMRFSEVCSKASAQPSQRSSSQATTKVATDTIADLRSRFVSPSLSVSYDKPLHIVRGHGQYLFDQADVTYLDCVNNVCHVGHCHPHVVKAATDQIAILNTNTRYLHANIVNYCLLYTSPSPRDRTRSRMPSSA